MKFNWQTILSLVFMVAVLIYTVYNYINGETNVLTLSIAVALIFYVGYGIVSSYRRSK